LAWKAGPSPPEGSAPHSPAQIKSAAVFLQDQKESRKPHMRKRVEVNSERGQTMTEFALVLPLLVMLLFGIIQFGVAFNNYITLTDAVRAGARQGSVSRQLANPVGATETKLRAAATDLKAADLQVSVTSTWESGEQVQVSASYPYSIKLLGMTIKSGRMHSTTTERVE
jgi:Flp pilus assembly protein TadG